MRRLGEAIVRHRKAVIIAWLVAIVAGLAASPALFGRLDPDYKGSSKAESVRALDRLGEQGAVMTVLVDQVRPDDAAVQSQLAPFAQTAQGIEHVESVQAPLAAPGGQIPPEAAALVAKDDHAVLINVQLAAGLDREVRDAAVARIQDAAKDLQAALHAAGVGDAKVTVGGNPIVFATINKQINTDMIVAEAVSVPITAVVLIVVFAGLIAALLPIAGAIASIAGGLIVLLGFSFMVDLSSQIVPVVTMLGLALAIDYSLLIVSRFREERADGADVHAAVVRTVEVAGRTVLFSAVTVAVSLLGLLVFTEPIFRSVGAAGVSVVVVALLGSITLVPALIAVLGHRIKIAHVMPKGEGRFAQLARAVQRRPWVVFVLVTALLVALASPALRMNMSASTTALLPKDSAVREHTDQVQERFPGKEADPVLVVSKADPAAVDAWLATLQPALKDDNLVRSINPATPIAGSGSMAALIPTGDSEGAAAQELVERVRADRLDADTLVTGSAAFLDDFKSSLADRAWIALTLVILVTFVLLFLLTGSVLIPIKALVMNVLSLGASFGALVLIFQDGHLSGLLGFTSTGAIETTIPVLVFAFAFGLSMDYEVFLLSRITEEHTHPEHGGDTDKAVAVGLQRSGRIITSAALLVIIVFVGFALAKTLILKEIGVALAVAVIVDATIVRMLLVPATMTLLGKANWWAPSWMARLQRRFTIKH